MYGHWGGGGWGFVMMLVALLFLALVVVGVLFLVRSPSHAGGTERPERSRALDLLDERFARGEIDRDDYEERRRVLTDGR